MPFFSAVRVEDITATFGEDYTSVSASASSTLTFSDAVSKTVDGSFDIKCDYKKEGLEIFKIVIENSNEGVLTEPSEAVVIINDVGMSNTSFSLTGFFFQLSTSKLSYPVPMGHCDMLKRVHLFSHTIGNAQSADIRRRAELPWEECIMQRWKYKGKNIFDYTILAANYDLTDKNF